VPQIDVAGAFISPQNPLSSDFQRRKNPMHIRHWLALGLTITQVWSLAQAADAPPPLSLDEARAQRARGKTLKHEAESRYETERAACQARVIAINCLSAAKERRIEGVRGGEAMEREGRKAEREAHQKEVAAREAKRAAEAPANQARQQADVERHHEKESQRAAEREKNRAEEATKLESRRSKLATEKAAQEKKMEERRKEDAKRAAKAPENARKAEERKRQHAERVKKIDERARQYADRLKQREAEEAAKQAAVAKGAAK
jgi:hypothetical protein